MARFEEEEFEFDFEFEGEGEIDLEFEFEAEEEIEFEAGEEIDFDFGGEEIEETFLVSDAEYAEEFEEEEFDDEEEEEFEETFLVSDAEYAEEFEEEEFDDEEEEEFEETFDDEEEEELEETFLVSDEKYAEEFEEEEFDDEEEEEFEETFLVSDAKYAEELQPQEVIMTSTIISQTSDKVASSSSETNQKTSTEVGPDSMQMTTEASESSLTYCEICIEWKEGEQMFSIDGCVHSFCTDCISKHVAAKIQDGISNVKCPGLNCKSVLELETCRPILPKGVLDLWEETLCNSLIASLQKCYCPFNDCSAVLLNDNKKVIRQSECPFCHRLFCAQCNVPWHSGVGCEEYQRLNEDERGKADLMVRELAKEKKWSRCPQCKFYVERTQGCPHIICRCRFQFCYGCDSEWTDSHGGCQRD